MKKARINTYINIWSQAYDQILIRFNHKYLDKVCRITTDDIRSQVISNTQEPIDNQMWLQLNLQVKDQIATQIKEL